MLREPILQLYHLALVNHLHFFQLVLPAANLQGQLFIRSLGHLPDLSQQLGFGCLRLPLQVKEVVQQLFVLFLEQGRGPL